MTDSKNNLDQDKTVVVESPVSPSAEEKAEILKAQEVEVDRVLENRRADFKKVSAMINKRLANGEKSYAGGMVKLEAELKDLKTKIEFYLAMKIDLSNKIHECVKQIVIETKRSEEEIVDQIGKRKLDDDARMMEIAERVGFRGPTPKLFPDGYMEPENEDPMVKKFKEVLGKSKKFLKGISETIASKLSPESEGEEEDEEGDSESEIETSACPHCGGACKDAFCENTGKPLSQDK